MLRNKIIFGLILAVGILAIANSSYAEQTGKRTHLIGLRHGQTDFNKAGVLQGGVSKVAGAHLNEEGKAQAAKLGQWLFEHYPHINSTVYSSPLERAKETAAIVNIYFHNSLKIVNGEGSEQDRVICDGFKEICNGPYDATLHHSVRDSKCFEEFARMLQEFKDNNPGKTPDRFFLWKTNPYTKLFERPERNENNAEEYEKVPETALAVYERASAAIRKIVSMHADDGRPIAIFGHGGMFCYLIDECKFRGLSQPMPLHYMKGATRISNCGVVHFYYDHDSQQLLFDRIEEAQ